MVQNPQLVAPPFIIIGFHWVKDHLAASLQATSANIQAKLAIVGQLDAPILEHEGLVEPPAPFKNRKSIGMIIPKNGVKL